MAISQIFVKTKELALWGVGNTIFPPHCVTCNVPVDSPHSLCNECFEQIDFISQPMCQLCGSPFEFNQGSEHFMCANCIEQRPPYIKARSAISYNDAARPLITKLKYADVTSLVPLAAKFMRNAGHELIEEGVDIIVPVPLHWRRMLVRRFNQSQLLATALGKLFNVPVRADILQRVKHTPPQASLARKERLQNIKTAFRVNDKKQADIKGKSVLLIDDVVTTGATIKSCSRALKKAGASKVYVLTLANRPLTS